MLRPIADRVREGEGPLFSKLFLSKYFQYLDVKAVRIRPDFKHYSSPATDNFVSQQTIFENNREKKDYSYSAISIFVTNLYEQNNCVN